MNFSYFFTFILSFFPFFSNSYKLETVYGSDTIKEPVLIELIECPAMQRLKNIHQYGIIYYIANPGEYSRFEHSLGVFFLVRKFGGSLNEQIAALLHDVSHTAFSHVGDYIFKHKDGKSSYQDDIHLWFLKNTEIPEILTKHGISFESINHKDNGFTMLEQDLPNVCADRFEYIMYGGLLENKLTIADIQKIMTQVTFKNGKWIFNSQTLAKKLADTSLYLSEQVFGSALNDVSYHWTAKALRRALKINLISLNDIHFSTDLVIWNKLKENNDPKIAGLVKKLCSICEHYKLGTEEKYDLSFISKFRGINPWVQTKDGIKQLTEVDKEYALTFNAIKTRMKKGLYICCL
ncbi:MAG: HD domain-containing protein [Candidatus Babeliales bacterium]